MLAVLVCVVGGVQVSGPCLLVVQAGRVLFLVVGGVQAGGASLLMVQAGFAFCFCDEWHVGLCFFVCGWCKLAVLFLVVGDTQAYGVILLVAQADCALLLLLV